MIRKTDNKKQNDLSAIKEGTVKNNVGLFEGEKNVSKQNGLSAIKKGTVKNNVSLFEGEKNVSKRNNPNVGEKNDFLEKFTNSTSLQNQSEPARTATIGIGGYKKMSFYKHVKVMARESQSGTPAATPAPTQTNS